MGDSLEVKESLWRWIRAHETGDPDRQINPDCELAILREAADYISQQQQEIEALKHDLEQKIESETTHLNQGLALEGLLRESMEWNWLDEDTPDAMQDLYERIEQALQENPTAQESSNEAQ